MNNSDWNRESVIDLVRKLDELDDKIRTIAHKLFGEDFTIDDWWLDINLDGIRIVSIGNFDVPQRSESFPLELLWQTDEYIDKYAELLKLHRN